MNDETALGSIGASDGRGYPRGSPREQSPLQTRASFLKNRSWELVVGLNRGACERGRAQHGFNSEAQTAVAAEWRQKQSEQLTLDETIAFLRHCHRRAPFLFFNGNTFADIGRQICAAIFGDLPQARRRELISAIAHYIGGVLDHDSMIELVASLCASATLKPGDRVKTLRGSTHGVIVRPLDDGRLVWKPDGSVMELTSLPEGLIPDDPKNYD